MYDENDGWFDHVPPPTPPAGTPGEYLTATPNSVQEPGCESQTLGITGPLGLGVRVPMLIISPFSRGGHIASETFDHTSQLQLVAARFGVEVPNVSAWRRATVSDLTSTMFQSAPSTAVPTLPATSVDMPLTGTCAASSQDTESGGASPSVPTKQTMPVQGGGSEPASTYYATTPERDAIADDDRTSLNFRSPGPQTTKSRHNRLAARPLTRICGPIPVGPHTGCGRWPSRGFVLGLAVSPPRLRPCVRASLDPRPPQKYVPTGIGPEYPGGPGSMAIVGHQQREDQAPAKPSEAH